MTTAFPETWLPIAHWNAYQVSDRGRVRRRPHKGHPTSRLVSLNVNTEGYQNVKLVRGTKEATFQTDVLICQTFNGPIPDKGMTVQHIDGVSWNNWASNLRWEYPVMAAHWYCGRVDEAQRGYMRFGPLPTKMDILKHTTYGDVLLAIDDNGKVVAFEFVFDQSNASRNPYDLSRYWRATVNSLTEVERHKGYDMVVKLDPNNPQSVYDAAESYRALARMHPDWLWASYLLDASYYIEQMANMVYNNIAMPAPHVVPAQRLSLPKEPVPIAVKRRSLATVEAPRITNNRRRGAPPIGFFTKG